MRKTWLVFPILIAAACGDDDTPATPDAPTGTIDGGGTPDSGGGTPDASGPGTPDADPGPQPDGNLSLYDFSCAGDPSPTTGPNPVTLDGTVSDLQTEAAIEGVTVEARLRADDSVIATDTTDSAGAFALSYANPSMTAVDAYVQLSGATDYPNVYIWPADPLSASVADLSGQMADNSTLNLLGILIEAHEKGTATGLVVVTDCAGTPIEGATVSFTPAAGAVRYIDGTLPTGTAGTDSTGVAVAVNVPAGDVAVNADYMGTALQTSNVVTVGDTVFITILHP